ncbi:MAG: hypothetical protein K0Q95_1047 [Bacteroidota bacterium]|jgi:hypothetical protein|nr:hypothetical protein [Bacteroidota bacterium]
MKTLKTIITSFLIAASSIGVLAQDFIGTNVRFSKEIETGGSYTAGEIGLIKLNDQNDEFSFDISLFPILTSPAANDSITGLNKQVDLNFHAQFPAGDLDFLANDGSEKTYSIPGELTINNITRPVKMVFGIHSSMTQANGALGIKTFPALVSFIIEINPAEYGLDFETINFVRVIRVEVRNGILNRSTQNSFIR